MLHKARGTTANKRLRIACPNTTTAFCAPFELLAVEVLLAPDPPDTELLAVPDALDDGAAVNEGTAAVDDGAALAEGAAVPTAAESSVTDSEVVAGACPPPETTQVAVLCTIVHSSFRVIVSTRSV